jgi:hypothetical protein
MCLLVEFLLALSLFAECTYLLVTGVLLMRNTMEKISN